METPYGEIPDRFVPDMSPQEAHDYLKKRYSRRSTLKAGALLAAAGPLFWRQSSAWASTYAAPQWIAYGKDPSTQMYISWAAGTSSTGPTPAVSKPQVQFGLDATYGQKASATASGQVPVPSSVSGEPSEDTVYSNVLLSSLTPGTTYHYSVSNDGTTWSPDVTFTTARAGAVDFRWAATADEATSANVTGNLATLIAGTKPEFVIVAGDLSYASGGQLEAQGASGFTPSAWDSYLGAVGPAIAQSTPWLVGVGNHEMEPLDQHGYAGFTTRFPQDYDTASGSPVTHSFTRGNVAFINLDGNDLSAEIANNNGYTGGAQTSWLASKLASYRTAGSGIDFIVVYFHNCVFCTNTTHGSDDGIRAVWQPLFDQYGVDLVINGHVHAYERTHPIKGGTVSAVVPSGGTVFPTTQGTTYILAGGGGQSLYTSWYGPTTGGDAGSATGPKKWQFATSETSRGGSGAVADVTDDVTGFSAYRKAAWSFITVDVTAPKTPGGVTTMLVQAYDPAQSGTTNSAGVVTPGTTPPVMDSVTLSRASTLAGPPASLPEVTNPAMLVGVAGLAAGGAYLASRRGGSASAG